MGLSPQYVLDEIQWYEIHALLKYQYYRNQEDWEQARFLGFITAKSNGAKISKLENLVKFQWEQKEKQKPQFMSDEDMNRLQNKAKWMIENNVFENQQ